MLGGITPKLDSILRKNEIMSKLKQGRYFLPYNAELLERAKEMRKNPTPAERKLWQECLREFPWKSDKSQLIILLLIFIVLN